MLLASLLFCVDRVTAAPIRTFAYEGIVDETDGDNSRIENQTRVFLGQTIRIEFTFDAMVPDGTPDITHGLWQPILNVATTLGGYLYTNGPTPNIEVFDVFLGIDAFIFNDNIVNGPKIGDLVVHSVNLDMSDFSRTAFDSDALPVTPPNPDDFDDVNFTITLRSDPIGQFGHVTANTLTVVPEPASLSLLTLGSLALIRQRRREK
jgi:hypothetical protein